MFYLYPSREDAERGEEVGGTGFFVGVKSEVKENTFYIYAVSNRHVVYDGASVIRVNYRDGGVDILEFDPSEWTHHPAGDDLAVIEVDLDSDKHRFNWIPMSMAVTPEMFAGDSPEIWLGDDVFQVGRFISHDGGKDENLPSIRFGNYSVPPLKHLTSYGHEQESFGVEVHSICGYSGSPVFCMRAWQGVGGGTIGTSPVRFMGVCWAHLATEEVVVERIIKVRAASMRPSEKLVQFAPLNTGMELVVPAWKLQELLDTPKYADDRAEYEARFQAEKAIVIEDVANAAESSA